MAGEERDRQTSPGPAELLPAAARLVASAWWRVAEQGAGASLRLGSRLARAARGAEGAPERPAEADATGSGLDDTSDATRSALRERGGELLRRSADVDETEDLHPAYARILDNLSPDEARILRLLATGGPQPAIDVRMGMPLVSELVASGLNVIGAEAGCRHVDRVPAYLDNLNRLGLIWFSRETLRDSNRYQVLEAQPQAVDAMRGAGRTARTVRRSIHLTRFGVDFCAACLPLSSAEQAPPDDGPGGGGD